MYVGGRFRVPLNGPRWQRLQRAHPLASALSLDDAVALTMYPDNLGEYCGPLPYDCLRFEILYGAE